MQLDLGLNTLCLLNRYYLQPSLPDNFPHHTGFFPLYNNHRLVVKKCDSTWLSTGGGVGRGCAL